MPPSISLVQSLMLPIHLWPNHGRSLVYSNWLACLSPLCPVPHVSLSGNQQTTPQDFLNFILATYDDVPSIKAGIADGSINPGELPAAAIALRGGER